MSTSQPQLDPFKNLALALQQQQPSPAIAAPVQMPDQSKPDLSISSGNQPNSGSRTPVQRDEAERARMIQQGPGESQIYGKVTNSDFGQKHPVLGKILGGLGQGAATLGDIGLSAVAPSLAINLPGTAYHHAMDLRGLNKQIGTELGEQEKQAQTAEAQGRVPLEAAQTAHVQQQTAAGEPVEITPEQAQQMGSPELAGEKVAPSVFAALSKQHGINTTKENTTQDTNDTRKEINQNTVQGRESVAGTQAASREKIAAEGDAVKRSLEQMRVASGVGRGAQGSTMTTRAMAEMATTVLPRMTAISGEVDRLANEIGPAVGRWNELMVNKGGADHPEFAHLDTDLDLLASAIVRTHFGARGGQQYRQELRKQFGEAQSPEDLKARIAAAQDWIQGYADMEQHPAGSQPGGKENDPLGIR